MKICVVVDNEFTNDIRVTNECEILSTYGYDVKVLCLNFGEYPEHEIINKNLVVHRISINRKYKNILFALTNFIDFYSYWWSFKIKKFVNDNDIDAIHVHDLYMSKSTYLATRKRKIKFTLDLHENYPYAVAGYKWMHRPFSKYIVKPWKWKKKDKQYLSYPDKIVVLSEGFKNELLERNPILNDNQFVVFPNVPDIGKLLKYKIDKNILSDKSNFVLFYFGVINKRRGIGLLFDSITELSNKIPNVKILLIGPVDKAETEWFNSKLKVPVINKHTIHYPWKDISLLPSYIMASSICLSPIEKNPQHESGIANKVFQYMLFKKPVIVSNCEPQEQVINTYNCGLVFQWDSVSSFSNNVLEIFNNPDKAIEMGNNGKVAVEKYFNNSALQNRLINLYQ